MTNKELVDGVGLHLLNKKGLKIRLESTREQLQEDIRTCMEGMWNMDEKHLIEDMLCQIVVDNFKKYESKDKENKTS